MSDVQDLLAVLHLIQNVERTTDGFGRLANSLGQAVHASKCWFLAHDTREQRIVASAPVEGALSPLDFTSLMLPLRRWALVESPESLPSGEACSSSIPLPIVRFTPDAHRLFATIDNHGDQKIAILAIRPFSTPFSSRDTTLFSTLTLLTSSTLQSHALRAAVQEGLSSNSELASVVGHELRTPLSGTMGYLQMAARRLVNGEIDPASKAISAALQLARAMEHQLDDLLDVGRYGRASLPMHRVTIDFADVAENVADCARVASPDHGFNVVCVRPAQVIADPLRLRRVLENLVANAVKFSPAGTNIRITVRPVQEDLLVGVTDEGPGIPFQHQRRIFERFYQVGDFDHRPGGLGLGLAIAQQIVEAHSGRIWCESEPGRGSTFYFSIPVQVDPHVAVA